MAGIIVWQPVEKAIDGFFNNLLECRVRRVFARCHSILRKIDLAFKTGQLLNIRQL